MNDVSQPSLHNHNIPNNSWTFGICTDGKTNVHFHQQIISSIRALEIPCFEIIFATEATDFNISEPNVRVLLVQPTLPAHITLKKNKIAEAALYPNLCMLHDYIMLDKNWFKEFNVFGYDWTVCSSPVVMPTCERFNWDWCTWRGPRGHCSAPYDRPVDQDNYVPGMYFCVKKEFLLQYPFDEKLSWMCGEDIEWSSRICNYWNYVFNPNAVVKTLKMKYY